jgi:type VI secretion system secreted protein Hcp
MSQTGSAHRGSGSGTGKVAVGDISITKFVDKASPSIMLACANGKHIVKGKLTVRKAGESPLEYLTYDLDQILISAYTTGGSEGGNERPTENITLNFAKVKVEYWTQSDKGAKGENATFSWDVAKNVKF